MKTLYLIRHAKARKDAIPDIQRPLTQRGISDAFTMANRLISKKIFPDMIISSPAKRAFTTAHIFATETKFFSDSIIIEKPVYEATKEKLWKIIHKMEDEYASVFLFGHNPSLLELANELTGGNIEHIPTCGVVGIEFKIKKWSEADKTKGEIVIQDSPKNISR